MTITIRGVEFECWNFDRLFPKNETIPLKDKFDLNSEGEVINFQLEVEFSLKVCIDGKLDDYPLHIKIINKNEALEFWNAQLLLPNRTIGYKHQYVHL